MICVHILFHAIFIRSYCGARNCGVAPETLVYDDSTSTLTQVRVGKKILTVTGMLKL